MILSWWLSLSWWSALLPWLAGAAWALFALASREIRRYGERRWRQGALDGVKATLELDEVPLPTRPTSVVRTSSEYSGLTRAGFGG